MRSEYRVMEVCGTHTHALLEFGLKDRYAADFDLISGPGCPVCVTSQTDIDNLLELCDLGVRIYTFSDLMKVPGKTGNLRDRKATGANVKEVYSPLEVLTDLDRNPAHKAVFVAIGFETTAPLVASLIEETEKRGIKNLLFYNLLKRIPPAMSAILERQDTRIDGFLCPGHVSAIIGAAPYRFVAEEYGKACVIAGFSQRDLLIALEALKRMLVSGVKGPVNAYPAAVREEGNLIAMNKIHRFFEYSTAEWRGLGLIPDSGLKLRGEYSRFDVFGSFSGLVLFGSIDPEEWGFFGKKCRPDNPVGPCMVSSEGACHARYLYTRW